MKLYMCMATSQCTYIPYTLVINHIIDTELFINGYIHAMYSRRQDGGGTGGNAAASLPDNSVHLVVGFPIRSKPLLQV